VILEHCETPLSDDTGAESVDASNIAAVVEREAQFA
jgi:hypothetical protein